MQASDPDSLAAAAGLARQLAHVHGAVRARVGSLLAPDHPEVLARAEPACSQWTPPPGPARHTGSGPGAQGSGFGKFADVTAVDGFAFPHGQMRAGKVGSVLTVVHGGRVAGAIGPKETMPDAAGIVRLLPQYFGVLPQHRGHGHGQALWRAAMH